MKKIMRLIGGHYLFNFIEVALLMIVVAVLIAGLLHGLQDNYQTLLNSILVI